MTNISNNLVKPNIFSNYNNIKSLTIKEKQRLYQQRPDIKAKQKEYYQRSDIKAKQKEYYQRSDIKEKQRLYYQTPEYKAKKKLYHQSKYPPQKNKQHLCKVCDGIFESNIQLKKHKDLHRI